MPPEIESGEDPAQSRRARNSSAVFLKAKEFTEELLKENERLRFKIASLEAPVDGGRRRRSSAARARARERLPEVETRYRKVEEENKEFADRYIEIEEQNNNLANLYVASYQLHSTLDYRRSSASSRRSSST